MALFEAYEDQMKESLRGLEEKLDKVQKMHAGTGPSLPHHLPSETAPHSHSSPFGEFLSNRHFRAPSIAAAFAESIHIVPL